MPWPVAFSALISLVTLLPPPTAVSCRFWVFWPSVLILAASKPSTRSLLPFLMMLARNNRAEPFRSRLCRLNSAEKPVLGA